MTCRGLLAVILIVLSVGCASRSPFDDGWHDGQLDTDSGRHARHELPRWVTDEWAADSTAASATTAQDARSDGDVRLDTLGDCIAWALDRHPAIQAAEARWHAARQRIVTAQTLPDPELTYRIAVDQVDTEQWPVGHTFGIAQMFPWFGTLDAAGAVRAAEARAAAQAYVAVQVSVAAGIKQSWAEYVYLHRAVEISRKQLALLESLESVVRSRFRAGETGQRDLLRVQAEIDRLTNDLRDVEDLMHPVSARLNAAIGRHAAASLPASPTMPQVSLEIDADALVDRFIRSNPDLQRLREQVAARRHARRLADQQFYPEFMVGIEYGLNAAKRMAHNERLAGRPGGGTDVFAARIGVRLPIWREAYVSASREALAVWGAALRDLHDRQNTIEADMKMAAYGVRDAERRHDLFGSRLQARANQVLESTQQAYRTGEATFTDLIESQRELFDYELAAARAEADRFQRLAELEALLGQIIEGLNTESQP